MKDGGTGSGTTGTRARVFEFIRRNPGIAGRARVAEVMHLRDRAAAQAIDALIERGSVVNSGTAGRPKLFPRETP